jgi:large subunit ribosomal protein L10
MKENRFSEQKNVTIQSLSRDIKESKSIAVVGIERVPSKQFQQIRKNLRGKARIRVVKKTLLKRAFEELNMEGITGLEKFMDGPIAAIFSNENSFKLYREVKSSRTRAPAKGGETAQEDVFLEAKATNLKPGPVVGELQKAGIPASIDQGKVVIRKDITLIKKGEKISREKALALAKLEILPLEIGLDFRASFEDGTLFKSDILDVSVEDTIGQLSLGHRNAIALSLNIGYFTRETTPIMISNAHRSALSLSVAISYSTKENIALLLAKAAAGAKAISNKLPEGVGQ